MNLMPVGILFVETFLVFTDGSLLRILYGVWDAWTCIPLYYSINSSFAYIYLIQEKIFSDTFSIFSEINFANNRGRRLFLKNWFGFYVDIIELFQSTLLC
jgi:hypothetical protein